MQTHTHTQHTHTYTHTQAQTHTDFRDKSNFKLASACQVEKILCKLSIQVCN